MPSYYRLLLFVSAPYAHALEDLEPEKKETPQESTATGTAPIPKESKKRGGMPPLLLSNTSALIKRPGKSVEQPNNAQQASVQGLPGRVRCGQRAGDSRSVNLTEEGGVRLHLGGHFHYSIQTAC